MNADDAIQAAVMADKWAARVFGSQVGEFLGIAWEAASRVPACLARRRAVLAIKDWRKLATRSRATDSAVRFSSLVGNEGRWEECHEPDRLDRLAWALNRARLTPKQADALRGWMHGASLASESVRLGCSKDRVSQLRCRALERLGGVP